MASILENPISKKHKGNVEIIPVTATSGYFGAKIVRFEYKWWWIPDVITPHSDLFSPSDNPQLKFTIRGNETRFSCTLYLQPCDSPDMILKYELSLPDGIIVLKSALTSVGSSTETMEIQSHPTNANTFFCDKNGDLQRDDGEPIDLPLTCKIVLIIPTGHILDGNPAKQPQCELVDSLQQLFLTHKCSDVTFVICGQEVPAHKGILSVRSPVFSAMFKHEMKEKREQRVDITDIEHEVFVEMIRFIYTNRVENEKIKNMVDKLLAAAEKYELPGLKATCEKVLIGELTSANAANTLILADLYGAKNLKIWVLSFIKWHLKDVMETQEFRSMAVSHPHLTVEILQGWTK